MDCVTGGWRRVFSMNAVSRPGALSGCNSVLRFNGMRADVFLHRLLPIVSTLAALGPGLQALKMFKARDLARTITQYGPLPQIQIPFVDYLTLSLAIMLLVAVIMEIARLRLAAPIALTIITVLWLY